MMSLNVTNNKLRNDCKWKHLICHKSSGDCMTISSDSLIKHTFFNTPFSIGYDGGLKYHDTIFKKSVRCSEFTDEKRCLVQTGWFNRTQFEHILEYRISSITDYWWIIDKYLKLWDNVYNEIKLYPMSKTALDVLIPITENNSNDFLFLRPVHFSSDPKYYYSSISILITGLIQNHDIQHFSNNRYVTYCKNREYIKDMNLNLDFNKCVLNSICSKTSGQCIYDIFGKNMYFHYISCVPAEYKNKEWFKFVKQLVESRYNECLKQENKSTHRNQLIKSKKEWFETLLDDQYRRQ